MENMQATTLFSLGVSVAMMGLVFGKLWPRARRESLQQDLFKLRNDLFIFMKENQFPFDNEAYATVRARLNATIRFCDVLSVPSIIVTAMFFRGAKSALPGIIERAPDNRLRSKLREVEEAMSLRVFKYLMLCPHAFPFIVSFFVIAAIHEGTKVVTPLLRFFAHKSRRGSEIRDLVKIAVRSKPVQAFMHQAQSQPDIYGRNAVLQLGNCAGANT